MPKQGAGDPEVGRRMREAAQAAGLSAGRIARAMAKSPSTVGRWWSGESEPSSGDMMRYCELVGRDVEEMYGREPQRLVALLLSVADRLMAGQPMGRALERELGAESVTPAERERLDALSSEFRRYLMEAAGRDWDRLSDEQKREILDQVRRLAQEVNDQGRRGGVVRVFPPREPTG